MGKFQKISRQITGWFFMVSFILTIAGCSIKEDFSNCFDDEFLLYVKVVDVETGQDVTTNGEVENAYLFLFDLNEKFERIYKLNASQIIQKEPIVIKDLDPACMIISVWGNVDNRINMPAAGEGDNLNNLILSLIKDPVNNEYDLAPSDLFYGFRENMTRTISTGEVVIKRKNARLYITVRGLEDKNEEKYYFRINNNHNGYDFQGIPIVNQSTIKEKGTFNHRSDFVSPTPHQLIHTDNSAQKESSVMISLFENKQDGDVEIAATNKDSEGNFITLISGKTTNILIEIGERGDLEIKIQVTPWDVIHLWEDY